MKDALIIFVRKPEFGKVKTRIAASVGDSAALTIYKKLLQHTHEVTRPLLLDKFVFYADAIDDNDLWNDGYFKLIQINGNLGARMKAAFTHLFDKGYNNICIIGSDCYELTIAIIEEAFDLLNGHDVVVGPAKDGGYYLLGMREGVKNVFEGIEWSTDKVLRQTLLQMHAQAYSYVQLEELKDIDTIDDVPEEWRQNLKLAGL
ncbi:MAG: glycosyltransferase [Flavisolibacter sp.]|jgi:rSAM/selenodomain-associated transferase 1|nr:glycosyltransferase [Flavisolibacter sp.]